MSDEKNSGTVSYTGAVSVSANALTVEKPKPLPTPPDSPTAFLRRKWIADMNEHIDLDTHWLLGGCGGFVLMEKDNTSSVDCIMWNAPSGHLLDFDKPARIAVASNALRLFKQELCRTLKLGAEEVDERGNE